MISTATSQVREEMLVDIDAVCLLCLIDISCLPGAEDLFLPIYSKVAALINKQIAPEMQAIILQNDRRLPLICKSLDFIFLNKSVTWLFIFIVRRGTINYKCVSLSTFKFRAQNCCKKPLLWLNVSS